jgi:hypothetical protein
VINDHDAEVIAAAAGVIASAIRSIAQGDEHGPSGCEIIGMALAGHRGEGLAYPVGLALHSIADSLTAIAESLEPLARIADALEVIAATTIPPSAKGDEG